MQKTSYDLTLKKILKISCQDFTPTGFFHNAETNYDLTLKKILKTGN